MKSTIKDTNALRSRPSAQYTRNKYLLDLLTRQDGDSITSFLSLKKNREAHLLLREFIDLRFRAIRDRLAAPRLRIEFQ